MVRAVSTAGWPRGPQAHRTGLDRTRSAEAGFYTKRAAEAWLQDILDQARRGTLPGLVRTEATFADAAAEYLGGLERQRPGEAPLTNRTVNKVLVVLHGVFRRARKVYGLTLNPVTDVE